MEVPRQFTPKTHRLMIDTDLCTLTPDNIHKMDLRNMGLHDVSGMRVETLSISREQGHEIGNNTFTETVKYTSSSAPPDIAVSGVSNKKYVAYIAYVEDEGFKSYSVTDPSGSSDALFNTQSEAKISSGYAETFSGKLGTTSQIMSMNANTQRSVSGAALSANVAITLTSVSVSVPEHLRSIILYPVRLVNMNVLKYIQPYILKDVYGNSMAPDLDINNYTFLTLKEIAPYIDPSASHVLEKNAAGMNFEWSAGVKVAIPKEAWNPDQNPSLILYDLRVSSTSDLPTGTYHITNQDEFGPVTVDFSEAFSKPFFLGDTIDIEFKADSMPPGLYDAPRTTLDQPTLAPTVTERVRTPQSYNPALDLNQTSPDIRRHMVSNVFLAHVYGEDRPPTTLSQIPIGEKPMRALNTAATSYFNFGSTFIFEAMHNPGTTVLEFNARWQDNETGVVDLYIQIAASDWIPLSLYLPVISSLTFQDYNYVINMINNYIPWHSIVGQGLSVNITTPPSEFGTVAVYDVFDDGSKVEFTAGREVTLTARYRDLFANTIITKTYRWNPSTRITDKQSPDFLNNVHKTITIQPHELFASHVNENFLDVGSKDAFMITFDYGNFFSSKPAQSYDSNHESLHTFTKRQLSLSTTGSTATDDEVDNFLDVVHSPPVYLDMCFDLVVNAITQTKKTVMKSPAFMSFGASYVVMKLYVNSKELTTVQIPGNSGDALERGFAVIDLSPYSNSGRAMIEFNPNRASFTFGETQNAITEVGVKFMKLVKDASTGRFSSVPFSFQNNAMLFLDFTLRSNTIEHPQFRELLAMYSSRP